MSKRFYTGCIAAGLAVALINQIPSSKEGESSLRLPPTTTPIEQGGLMQIEDADTTYWKELPIVPDLSGEIGKHVREIATVGQQNGRDIRTVTRVGDSMSVGPYYLPNNTSSANLGEFDELQRVLDTYQFIETSYAIAVGWSTFSVLQQLPNEPDGQDTPILKEIAINNAGITTVMFGANDIVIKDIRGFERDLNVIISTLVDAGIVPILRTITPQSEARTSDTILEEYNAIIATVAQQQRIPLINTWRAFAEHSMVNGGLMADGLHPNILRGDDNKELPLDFTPEGLSHGHNVQNLITLQTLLALNYALQ